MDQKGLKIYEKGKKLQNEGGGGKGRLEFFRKIIRFGKLTCPLMEKFVAKKINKIVEKSVVLCGLPSSVSSL